MKGGLILALVGLTSLGAYLLGRKASGFRGQIASAVIGKMLEGVGITLAFCAANLAIASASILIVRHVIGTFISLYPVWDLSLCVLSLLQGLTFQSWRDLSAERTREFRSRDSRPE